MSLVTNINLIIYRLLSLASTCCATLWSPSLPCRTPSAPLAPRTRSTGRLTRAITRSRTSGPGTRSRCWTSTLRGRSTTRMTSRPGQTCTWRRLLQVGSRVVLKYSVSRNYILVKEMSCYFKTRFSDKKSLMFDMKD